LRLVHRGREQQASEELAPPHSITSFPGGAGYPNLSGKGIWLNRAIPDMLHKRVSAAPLAGDHRIARSQHGAAETSFFCNTLNSFPSVAWFFFLLPSSDL
jgi:hypothetical protein